MTILSEDFWNAVLNGIFLSNHKSILSFKIEPYAEVIEQNGYAQTLYGSDFKKDWDFYINILAIKHIFFISLYPLKNPKKNLGVINYNPRRKIKGAKVKNLCYFEKQINKKKKKNS